MQVNQQAAIKLADLRTDYAKSALDESAVASEPLAQLQTWLAAAIAARCPEPSAMSLATVGASGRPSSRIVLLKEIDARGLVFYTNYESRKGRELAANPAAALLFYWVELEREVRIEGQVERVAAAAADAYFNSRPLKSRIAAIVSPQSSEIAGREWLEQRFAEAEARLGEAPARPLQWGGYRLIPEAFEFWQGRRSRLHDRIAYSATAGGWRISRLAP